MRVVLLTAIAAADFSSNCSTADFPTKHVNKTCYGLTITAAGNASPGACRQVCCDAGKAKCNVWEYIFAKTLCFSGFKPGPAGCTKTKYSNGRIGEQRQAPKVPTPAPKPTPRTPPTPKPPKPTKPTPAPKIPTAPPTLHPPVPPLPPHPNPPTPAPQPGARRFKKGVAYYGGNCGDFSEAGMSNVSWFYDWGLGQVSMSNKRNHLNTSCNSDLPDHSVNGIEYIPQVFSRYALANISNIDPTYLANATYVFGFNEPDHSGSYMKPQDGAARWEHMEDLADKYNLTIVGPCVSNYNSGEWWLSVFREVFKNNTGREPRMDHMCLHTYFEPNQVEQMFGNIGRMYKDYKRPIWINEFACPPYKDCTAADELKFAKIAVPRLEATDYIYRYAWFQARQGVGPKNGSTLLDLNASTVKRTLLGDWYNSF